MAGGQKVVGIYIGKRRLSVQTTLPGSLLLLLLSPPRRKTVTLSSPKPQLPSGHSQPSQNPHHQVDMACQLESVSLFHR